MADFLIVPATQLEPQRLREACAAAFADYLIGPFTMTLEQWPLFLGRQGAQLPLSRVALRGDDVLAFALVAPRSGLGTWRLAMMGAVPAARGSGAAGALLDDFIARAGAAGMRAVELECFEQNERALRLYRGRGFADLHRLYGYARAASLPAPAAAATPQALTLDEAFAWLDAASLRDRELPLQVTPVSLRALPVPLQAWRLGVAQVVFSEGAEQKVTIHSLVDQGNDAQALIAALLQRYAGWTFGVPQLQRLDLGGAALESLGFERLALNQVLMRRESGGPA